MPYSSIQNAYNDNANTLDGDTLEILSTTLSESPNLSRPISITLKGGYDCAFNNIISYSFIHGSLTISSGTVTVENILIY